MQPTGYVSVIATNLCWALGRQLEVLEAAEAVPPNDLQTNSSENGHALAVVVIAVLILESAINRLGYVLGGREASGRLLEHPAAYFNKVCDDVALAEEVAEAFSLRDAIVHNHFWEATFVWDEEGIIKVVDPPRLLPGFGNARFMKVVASATLRTKRLALNVVPTRVWRRDAYLVLRTMFRALDFAQTREPRLGIVGRPFVVRHRVVGWADLVKHVESKLGEVAQG